MENFLKELFYKDEELTEYKKNELKKLELFIKIKLRYIDIHDKLNYNILSLIENDNLKDIYENNNLKKYISSSRWKRINSSSKNNTNFNEPTILEVINVFRYKYDSLLISGSDIFLESDEGKDLNEKYLTYSYNTSDSNYFGNLIKNTRTVYNLNRDELAVVLNVSSRTIQNWENNGNSIKYNKFFEFLNVFKINMLIEYNSLTSI